jgi:HEPN domain-containing protein
MKQPEVVLRDLVRQWFAKAELDFRAAERLVKDPEPLREIIAFHCQQAAEKYLKALLVSRQIEFPKTHDLEELLELLAPVRPDVAAMLEGIEVLNPFGVKIRYPGDFPELLPGQEQTMFDVASRTREAIMAQLQQHLAGD